MNPPNPCFRLRPTLFEPSVHNSYTLQNSLLLSEALGMTVGEVSVAGRVGIGLSSGCPSAIVGCRLWLINLVPNTPASGTILSQSFMENKWKISSVVVQRLCQSNCSAILSVPLNQNRF